MNKIKDFDDLYTTDDPTLKPSVVMDPDSQKGQYETYGEDLEYVRTFPNQKRVWTIIEGEDDNNMYAIAGYHLVNRIIYVISDQEWVNEWDEVMWCEFESEELTKDDWNTLDNILIHLIDLKDFKEIIEAVGLTDVEYDELMDKVKGRLENE